MTLLPKPLSPVLPTIKRHSLKSMLLVMAVLIGAGNAPLALADTQPPADTPATVSTDPLPTAQINGVVYAQVTVGNTVYATGKFTAARPAGVPLGGAGTVVRNNLVAYDITTGALNTSFAHNLQGSNAIGRAIAASPDGTKLYVGGTFTAVDGQPRQNIAAFTIPSGTLAGGFTVGTNGGLNNSGEIWSMAATNTMVYAGGRFTSAGGQTHNRIAAFTPAGSVVTSWAPSVTSTDTGYSRLMVTAMTVVPSSGNLVFGGYFDKVNGATRYSNAAVKLTTGALVTPWASEKASFPVRQQLTDNAPASSYARFTSASTDGTQVFLTTAFDGLTSGDGAFEGRVSINPVNGNLNWLNDCYGNNWSGYPIGGVLYSVGHSHNCSPAGGFPEQPHQFALAESTAVAGKNGSPSNTARPSFEGQPRSSQLVWAPKLAGTGGFTGEVAWSVTGNSNYISLGGDFTDTSGKAQQGLVRYAIAAKAANKQGPAILQGAGYNVMVSPAAADGTSKVRIYNIGDPDNARLTYEVYRVGTTKLLSSQTVTAAYWQGISWTFNDTGVTPGRTMDYKVVVKDPYGNAFTIANATAINDTSSAITYSSGWGSSQGQTDRAPDFARGIHYTNKNGATMSYTFYGSQITLLGEKKSDRGTATVSIDGGAAVNINNMQSSKTLFQQVMFTKSGLTNGKHTVKLTKTGGGYIDLDAIVVR